MTLRLLYQDEYLVAIDKPAGLLVHRSWLDRHETQFAMQRTRDVGPPLAFCYLLWIRKRLAS